MQLFWRLLRPYKTDHATTSMQLLIYSNASKDSRLWINGSPSSNPLKWHDHTFTLVHHVLRHPYPPLMTKQPYGLMPISTSSGRMTPTLHTHRPGKKASYSPFTNATTQKDEKKTVRTLYPTGAFT